MPYPAQPEEGGSGGEHQLWGCALGRGTAEEDDANGRHRGDGGGCLSGPIDRIHDHCCVGLASLACSILLYGTCCVWTYRTACTGCMHRNTVSPVTQCVRGQPAVLCCTKIIQDGGCCNWYCTMKYSTYIQNIHCISSELTGPEPEPEPDQPLPLRSLLFRPNLKGQKPLTSLFSFRWSIYHLATAPQTLPRTESPAVLTPHRMTSNDGVAVAGTLQYDHPHNQAPRRLA